MGGRLSSDVREVDLLSDEGIDLGMALGEKFDGVPVVVQKNGEQLSVCNIFEDPNRIYAKCQDGEKDLA